MGKFLNISRIRLKSHYAPKMFDKTPALFVSKISLTHAYVSELVE